MRVSPDEVDYEFGPDHDRIEMTSYDPQTPNKFTLPSINGKPWDLHPSMTYQSPYLNGAFGSDKITVTVGPIKRILDFSVQGE